MKLLPIIAFILSVVAFVSVSILTFMTKEQVIVEGTLLGRNYETENGIVWISDGYAEWIDGIARAGSLNDYEICPDNGVYYGVGYPASGSYDGYDVRELIVGAERKLDGNMSYTLDHCLIKQ